MFERLPYLHERSKRVGPYAALGRQRAQYPTTSQERLPIGPVVPGEIGDDLVGELLLVSDPFQELGMKRGYNDASTDLISEFDQTRLRFMHGITPGSPHASRLHRGILSHDTRRT